MYNPHGSLVIIIVRDTLKSHSVCAEQQETSRRPTRDYQRSPRDRRPTKPTTSTRTCLPHVLARCTGTFVGLPCLNRTTGGIQDYCSDAFSHITLAGFRDFESGGTRPHGSCVDKRRGHKLCAAPQQEPHLGQLFPRRGRTLATSVLF